MILVAFAIEKWAFAELISVISLEIDFELAPVLFVMVQHVTMMKPENAFANELAPSAGFEGCQVVFFQRRFVPDWKFVMMVALVVWEHVCCFEETANLHA